MFKLSDAYKEITLDNIFNQISEYELWKYYCSNFKEIDKPFLSELYNDKNPDCRIFYSNTNHLIYKDFGDNGKIYGILDYIQDKYSCDFKKCLNIIASDFNIIPTDLNLNKVSRPIIKDEYIKYKAKIDILIQPFNLVDYKYWNQYCIPLELLYEEEIYSCKYVYLTTIKGIIKYESSKNNPIYAWKEYDINLNYLGYKVYMPYSKQKWLNSSTDNAIQGIKFLKFNSNLLFKTKSRKDILVLKILGYESFSNSSENIILKENDYNYLFEKVDIIISLLDNDKTGIKYSELHKEIYNIPYIFVDDEKDISDYIKKYGLEQTKLMIDNKIKELNEK